MKKLLILPIALLFLILFLFKNNSPSTPHTMDYFQDFTFNFITIYDEKDPLYTQKIYSMIDQEYDNYQILLIVDTNNKKALNEIENYAKKRSKAHIIKVITRENDIPIPVLIKNEVDKIDQETVLVFLEGSLILTSVDVLSKLHTIFCEATNSIYVYANHTNFPSLQINKGELTFNNSPFKAFYAEDLQNLPIQYFEGGRDIKEIFKNLAPTEVKTYFIKESLYLHVL